MKKNKIILILTGIVFLGVIIFGANYAIDLSYYKKLMPTVKIKNVDISKIDDGVYTGNFDARIISADVRVSVKNGKITDIELINHKFERGGSAVSIIDEILSKQSLEIDTVTGATNSSKTILKAVENALNNNEQ